MTFDLSPWSFFLVFGRTSALVAFFPMMSELQTPKLTRVGIAAWISLAALPVVPHSAWQPANIPDLVLAVGLEAIVGVLFAFTLRLVFAAVMLGAQWIDNEVGFQAAQQINPISGAANSPYAMVILSVSGLIFWAFGFFEDLLLFWVRTFQLLPPPVMSLPLDVGDVLLKISTRLFIRAIEIATPMILLMFLVTLSIGLMARAIQGVNIFMESYNIKLLVGIAALVPTAPLMFSMIQKQVNEIPEVWMALLYALRGSP
ncbi:MAG: flagellar biosynthetic protein FliR [Verrucomicrobia bacterium]|nr:flagellar biosynthetic protein FliR [Verrucomicrobiota bacterium]